MEDELDSLEVHPPGDLEWLEAGSAGESHLETYGGRVHVEWDPSAKVTAFGPLSYFIHFLKTSGLWDEWVELCPLRFASNNAPSKQKILGTVLLSILAGHKRYAHITTVRSDKVLPELLGIEGLASEDSVRRAFTHASDEELTLWLDRCMNTVFEPLLSESWVLDVDATVKTLYGKQEEARVGYNPMKTGRPSHVYHAYCIARLRMLLNFDVQAGNQIASEYAHAGLWAWLDARPREQWPVILRRVEEPVGVDGLHDPGFEAEPVDGADRRAGLQLVEFVGAIGGIGPPHRSGDEPAGAGLWSCQTDHAREPVQSDDHELPWQGGSDREVTG